MNQNSNRNSVREPSQLTQQIHLTDRLNVIKKHKWLIITLFLVTVSLVSIYSFTTSPVYMATTQLEIERPFLSEQSLESAMSREYRTIEDDFETQIHLLSNPDLVHEVIKNLDLKKEFDAIYGVDVEKAIFSTPPFAKSNSSENYQRTLTQKTQLRCKHQIVLLSWMRWRNGIGQI